MAVSGLGMNVSQLVSQLMAVERQPLRAMDSKERAINTKITDLGRLKSELSSLKSAARKLTSFDFLDNTKAESSDATTVKVTASGSAVPSRYNIEVNQLASAKSLAYDVSANDTKTAISGLQGQIKVNGKDVDLGSSDISLDQLVQKVNSADTGFVASAIKQGSGSYKLVFVNKETGETTGGADVAQWDLGSTTAINSVGVAVNEGKNARYVMNGISLESTTNKIEDAIQGVTLDLNKIGSVAVDVKKDDEAIVKKVQDFVDAYNASIANANTLRRYPNKDNASDQGGSFKGDSMLSSLNSSLRQAVTSAYGNEHTKVAGEGTSLGYAVHSIGLSFDKEGKMKLDEKKLKESYTKDPDGVKKMLAEGPAKALIDTVDHMTEKEGLLGVRTESLEAQKRNVSQQRVRLETGLQRREESLMAQYSRLDAMIAKMQSSFNGVRSLFGY